MSNLKPLPRTNSLILNVNPLLWSRFTALSVPGGSIYVGLTQRKHPELSCVYYTAVIADRSTGLCIEERALVADTAIRLALAAYENNGQAA